VNELVGKAEHWQAATPKAPIAITCQSLFMSVQLVFVNPTEVLAVSAPATSSAQWTLG
jgi:hypothetical protein